jgi:hypothetical protein
MTKHTYDDDGIWTEKVWRVRSADGDSDGEVGPVSLDQVRRGIEAGKLDAAAKVARNGTDNWLSARNIIEAAITRDKALVRKEAPDPDPLLPEEISRVQVSDPDRTTPGARMPAGTKGAGAMVPLALLAVLGVAGACWVSYRLVGPRPSAAIPRTEIAVERLPRSTVAVVESRIRDDLEEVADVGDSHVGAWLAERACGGVDLEQKLRKAKGASLVQMHDLGVIDLMGQVSWLKAMRCGADLQRGLSTPRQTTIVFEREGFPAAVTSVTLDREAMPEVEDGVAHTYAGLQGFCQKAEDGESSCRSSGPGGLRDGRIWFFGPYEAVEAFAASYTSAHRETSSNADILAALSRHASDASSRTRLVRPSSIPWAALCEQVAPHDDRDVFLRACFPAASRVRLDGTETKIRGLLVERDHVVSDSRLSWSVVLLARSDDAARWIEGDLVDLRRDWQSVLVDNEPDLLRLLRESPTTGRERLWAGAADPIVRALSNVRVVRAGTGVRLEMSAELTAEERKLVSESLETSDPEDQAMVSVLDALSEGASPPVEALSRFLGGEVAAWAAAPRATEADCKQLLSKYEALAADPSALEQVDLRDRWGRAFEPDVCRGMVLPDGFRSCLMGASSLEALAQCPPPRSPYVAEAHRRLKGQWSVVDVDGGQLSYFARMSLRGCRLEVGEDRVGIDCLGERGAGALRIETRDLEGAVIYLPWSKGLVPKLAAFGKAADTWVMTDFAPGVQLTFRRDNFARSLFDR